MKLNSLRNFFIKTKTKLISLCNHKRDYDLEQIEYLIKLIDYFITDKIKLTKKNFTIFLDEIVTTSVMQADFELLEFVKPFSNITGEANEISL